MYKPIFALFAFLLSASWVEGQGVLQGQIRDNIEPLIGASVKITQKDSLIRGIVTDVEGNFSVLIDSGNYDVEVFYTGYETQKVEKLAVLAQKFNFLNVVLADRKFPEMLCSMGWKVPLLNRDGTESGQTLTGDQMRHMY